MRKINKIIIHCSGSDKDKTTLEDIRRWHVNRGWSDIGYHYVIEGDGMVRKGRPIEEVGAHCYGHNKDSIGVCLCGGDLDLEYSDDFNESQFDALSRLVEYLQDRFPGATIHPHREFTNKACPSFSIWEVLDGKG